MNINDIKHLAVERIFLVPDASEGQLGYVWCDDPAPGMGMDASEAVEYVRKDVHDQRIAELEERDLIKQAQVLEDQVEKLRDNADSARENGYSLQAAGMEDAADFIASDAAALRLQAEQC